MFKNKRTTSLLLALLVVALVALTGCGGGTNAPAAAPDTGSAPDAAAPAETPQAPAAPAEDVDFGDPVALTLGHPYPTSDYRAVAMDFFAAQASELSGGNITVTTFPSQGLTTSQDAMKSVGSGVADMASGAFSFNVSEVPALAPLDIQGIYDPDYFWETYEIIKPTLDEILATQNQMALIMFDESDSVFYLGKGNAKEVHSPADIKGLRLRDHGMWIGKSITAWGAAPMTIMPADLNVALDRGTVDGGYTGWGFANSYRVFESAPYITFTKIAKSTWAPVTINLDRWNSLSKPQQDVILEAAAAAEAKANELLDADLARFTADVEAAGGSIYHMTPEENQVFVDATKPLIEEARAASGDLGNKLIDAFLTAPSNYRD
ncbi:MAG: TRAP transporter substrate-binding protein DctP [Clostridiales Family XIII bacterium]|jgi:TRAP-type C4-dicarboxylate transport system substrate-binding protein|nr:TRAP transporter substrate-binding protein DctP [Clostridiales Family XIII bacterium]